MQLKKENTKLNSITTKNERFIFSKEKFCKIIHELTYQFHVNPLSLYIARTFYLFPTPTKKMAYNQSNNPALDPDTDSPNNPAYQLAQFGAGCFWGVELAFQRVEGVVKTEVGYSQGLVHNPNYNLVCTGTTKHSEIVRVEFDPSVCPYNNLLSLFWSRHDPTTLNRQQGDVGTQYRSGIYYYNEEQACLANESLNEKQKDFKNKIVTEILPAKRFYKAEEYHQQYLAKGGRAGSKQSAAKGCNDPIRCYG